MEALGESPSGAHHHLFPFSAALWEAPVAGLGGVLEVTGSCLTEAETETQAEEMTWSRSHSKAEMGVEQELKLTNG